MWQEFWLTPTPPMNQCEDVGTADCVITLLVVGNTASLILAIILQKRVILRGVDLMQILLMRARADGGMAHGVAAVECVVALLHLACVTTTQQILTMRHVVVGVVGVDVVARGAAADMVVAVTYASPCTISLAFLMPIAEVVC